MQEYVAVGYASACFPNVFCKLVTIDASEG